MPQLIIGIGAIIIAVYAIILLLAVICTSLAGAYVLVNLTSSVFVPFLGHLVGPTVFCSLLGSALAMLIAQRELPKQVPTASLLEVQKVRADSRRPFVLTGITTLAFFVGVTVAQNSRVDLSTPSTAEHPRVASQVQEDPPPRVSASHTPFKGEYGSLAFDGSYSVSSDGSTTTFTIEALAIRFVPNSNINRVAAVNLRSIGLVASEKVGGTYNILSQLKETLSIQQLSASDPVASIGRLRFRLPTAIVNAADHIAFGVGDGDLYWPIITILERPLQRTTAGSEQDQQPSRSDSNSKLVIRAQTALLSLGCQPGPIDGQWGPSSRAALDRLVARTPVPDATDPPNLANVWFLESLTGKPCSRADEPSTASRDSGGSPPSTPQVRSSWSDKGAFMAIAPPIASDVRVIDRSSEGLVVVLNEYESSVEIRVETMSGHLPTMSSDRNLNASFGDDVDMNYSSDPQRGVCIFAIGDGAICHTPNEPRLWGKFYSYLFEQTIFSDETVATTWRIPKYVLSAGCNSFSMSIASRNRVKGLRPPSGTFTYQYSETYSAFGDIFADSALGARTIRVNEC
jgi:hypothetical protein